MILANHVHYSRTWWMSIRPRHLADLTKWSPVCSCKSPSHRSPVTQRICQRTPNRDYIIPETKPMSRATRLWGMIGYTRGRRPLHKIYIVLIIPHSCCFSPSSSLCVCGCALGRRLFFRQEAVVLGGLTRSGLWCIVRLFLWDGLFPFVCSLSVCFP